MQTFTFGDRKRVRELMGQAALPDGRSDSDIVRATSLKLARSETAGGLQKSLVRAACSLCYQLLYSECPQVVDAARAALRYLLLENDAIPDSVEGRGLDDDLYVMHATLRRVAEFGGLTPGVRPRLIAEHESAVCQALNDFHDSPCDDGPGLVAACEHRLAAYAGHAPTGIVQELRRDIGRLEAVNRSSGNADVQAWARAGLRFIGSAEHLVPVEFGAPALLDRAFAAHIALVNCGAPRAAIVDALDRRFGRLPFLDLITFAGRTNRLPASEYATLNSAFADQSSSATKRRVVLAPAIDNAALLASVMTALSHTYESREALSTLPDFKVGQLVRLTQGEDTAVGEFCGYEDRDGVAGLVVADKRIRKWFALTPEILASLTVAKKGATRGLKRIRAKVDSLEIGPLDLLFESRVPLRLEGAGCAVVLHCRSVAQTRETLERTRICGVPVSEALPVGGLPIADDEPVGWSQRWRGATPILAVTSSALDLCEFVEDLPEGSRPTVVIEDAARWAGHPDLVRRLVAADSAAVAYGRYADQGAGQVFGDAGFQRVRWDQDELASVEWPAEPDGIFAAEARIRDSLSAVVDVEHVSAAEVEECWTSLSDASGLFEERRAYSAAAGAALASAWKAFTVATRWILPVASGQGPHNDIAAASREMQAQVQAVADDAAMADGFRRAQVALERLAARLLENNPKWNAAVRLLGPESESVIVASNGDMRNEYTHVLADHVEHGVPVASALKPPAHGFGSKARAVVAGWYRAGVMARLLDPPIAPKVSLLLWDFERRHFDAWAARNGSSLEAPSVVESLGGGFRRSTARLDKAKAVPPSASRGLDESYEVLEAGVVRESALRASEASRRAADADELVEARLVAMKGSLFAFLPRDGSAQTVTELLLDDGEAAHERRIRLKPVDELVPGDLVLFHTGTEGDAIRVQADLLMEQERAGSASRLRRLASLWRDALARHKSARGLSARELTLELAENGCVRDVMTVRKWLSDDDLIAPQRYRSDLQSIASMTGDTELADAQDKCVNAIAILRGKHLEASNALARSLLEKARDADGRTTGDFGAGLFVGEVTSIDAESLMVSRSGLRKLHSVGVTVGSGK